jgi:hypothetical protein
MPFIYQKTEKLRYTSNKRSPRPVKIKEQPAAEKINSKSEG